MFIIKIPFKSVLFPSAHNEALRLLIEIRYDHFLFKSSDGNTTPGTNVSFIRLDGTLQKEEWYTAKRRVSADL
jgi:hypothetical protein